MNIVLLGAPGSGKGTQAKRISQRYNVPHISTGDIFRQEIAKKSDLGLQVEGYVKSGRLVPDDLTVSIVSQRLFQKDCEQGFVLDGFPRTVGQAEALDAGLSSAKKKLNKVIDLELSENEVVQRLSSRRQCEKCGKIYNLTFQPPRTADQCDADAGRLTQRDDDRPETIMKRLMIFEDLTAPLIAYYRAQGLLETVNGNQDMEAVSRSIYKILDGMKAARA
jgi:adenylate kinase